jgi:hypothetical protein
MAAGMLLSPDCEMAITTSPRESRVSVAEFEAYSTSTGIRQNSSKIFCHQACMPGSAAGNGDDPVGVDQLIEIRTTQDQPSGGG